MRAPFLMLALPLAAAAQQQPEPQHGGTFYPPPGTVEREYLPLPRSPQPMDRLLAPGGVQLPQVTLSLDLPLRHGGSVGFATQGPHATSPTLQADVRWQPRADEPWFVRAIFYRYLRPGEQQPWNPDYTYAFGYEDFRPGTWSLTYSNYSGTRWNRANFREGLWSLARRFELPKPVRPWFLVGDGDDAVCRASVDLTPRFADVGTGAYGSNRSALTLGCRYSRPRGWFADVTLFAYPGGKQQPWDPDFTYVLGYADSRPGTISLQYGNYSGNRFPGRTRGSGEGDPRSGSITLSWRIDW
jgi:hypothetical protein